MELFRLFGTIMVDNKEANQQISATSQGAAALGDTFVGTFGHSNQFSSSLNMLSRNLKTSDDATLQNIASLARFAAQAAIAVTAVVAIGKGLYDSASKTAEYGDNVDEMSQKLGLSTKAYQEWSYVMKLSGSDIESMGSGFKTMTNTLADAQNGSQTAIDKFGKLGISMTDLQTKSQEDIFKMTVAGLQNMDDQTQKAALANDLFGKSGQNLMPVLNQTNAETQTLIDNTSKYGLVMSDDAVKASAKFKDTQDTLKASFEAIGNNIGEKLMPYFQKFLDWILEHMPEIQKIVDGAMTVIGNIFDTVGAVVGWVSDQITTWGDNFKTVVKDVQDTVAPILNKLSDLIYHVTFGMVNLGGVANSSQGYDSAGFVSTGYSTATNESGIYDDEGNLISSLGGYAKGGILRSGQSVVVGEAGAELLQNIGGNSVVTPLGSSSGKADTGRIEYLLQRLIDMQSEAMLRERMSGVNA